MRVVAMAGRVSGSSVRTQNRFCGLWMGCTVGLGPAGEGLWRRSRGDCGRARPLVASQRETAGLGGGHAAPAGSCLGSPGPLL